MPAALTERVVEVARLAAVHNVKSLDARLALMRQMHELGLRDPEVRGLALRIVRECPERDDACELRALFNWYKTNIRYSGDPEGRDTYASPRRTLLEWKAADCDDAVVSLGCLVRHNGFKVGARVVQTGPEGFDPVYAIAGFPKENPTGYVALDPTVATAYPGWEPQHSKRKDYLW